MAAGDEMSAFTVQMEDRPGELARLCEAIAAHKINIVLSAIAHGDRGSVAFVVDDERLARTALDDAGIEFTERPAITVRMENVPAAGAGVFRKLAAAGVNLDLLLAVQVSQEEFFAVICVDQLGPARAALGEQIVGERDTTG
jgi:hypothetical protein